MWPVITETIRILNESAIYLLLGFGLAGVMHVLFARSDRLTNLLRRRGSRSVILASLLGVPLPLCSCSVLPAGLALRKQGASRGATASFLISVPETDVVSILMTYGLLGPLMAIFRPLAALVTAIVTGQAMNWLERWIESAPPPPDAAPDQPADAESCAKSVPEDRPAGASDPPQNDVRRALRYGFVTFFDDIIGSLLIGIILGGVISAVLPQLGLDELAGGSIVTMLAMLLLAMPMYVCATSSTPIAVGLIVGGISPGAALVFLLAGPATNMASVIVLGKHLGKAALAVYLTCIAVISILMGLILDGLLATVDSPLVRVSPAPAEIAPGPIKIAAAVVFVLLSLASLRRIRAFHSVVTRVRTKTGLPVNTTGAAVGLIVIAIVCWLASGFFIVGPGERGVITRFGGITQANLQPGLHYHWPAPIGKQDIEKVTEIKRLELGFRSDLEGDASAYPLGPETEEMIDESWMLTGNEDIIDIKWVVHYRIRGTEDALLSYLYGIQGPDKLVRDAAESAIRTAVANRNIDTLLTVDRAEVERHTHHDLLQPRLDRCNAGVEVLSVKLRDVHAPPEVHAAFRDVASAAEDKETAQRQAEKYQEQITRSARGDAARRLAAARAQAVTLVERASGDANAFLKQLSAYRSAPDVTRLRLHFESLDEVLAPLNKYVNLIEDLEGGLDFWLVPRSAAVDVPNTQVTPRRNPLPPMFRETRP